jgi:hypothetical protein
MGSNVILAVFIHTLFAYEKFRFQAGLSTSHLISRQLSRQLWNLALSQMFLLKMHSYQRFGRSTTLLRPENLVGVVRPRSRNAFRTFASKEFRLGQMVGNQQQFLSSRVSPSDAPATSSVVPSILGGVAIFGIVLIALKKSES